jgi:acyl transferase domain-containing protein
MGKELADNFQVARETFQEVDEALGFSISHLCFNGPEEALKLTHNTQPAILAVSVAALRVLLGETGIHPVLLAGHSLGECIPLSPQHTPSRFPMRCAPFVSGASSCKRQSLRERVRWQLF